MLKRRIRKLCLFLLLGAVINVAVAWTCVLAQSPVCITNRYYHDPNWKDILVVGMHEGWGYCVASGVERPGKLLKYAPEWVDEYHGAQWWHPDALSPQTNNYAIACGWPKYALTSWRTVQDQDEMRFPGIIHRGLLWQSLVSDHPTGNVECVAAILAFQPIWPGFAINTIFYAAILWLLFAFPFVIRRRRRIKRGLCARCGYPAGASAVCSECGTAVHGAAAPCNPCSQP